MVILVLCEGDAIDDMLILDGKNMIKKTPSQLFEEGFVVVDLETTGLAVPDVAIVEVAVVDHHGEILLNTLVNPACRIPILASQVHGIYDEHVAKAAVFEAIYPELAELLAGRNAVAYNHEFEISIFNIVCKRLDLPSFPDTLWHCAMRAYSDYRRQRKFYKLTNACQNEGIVVADAHRALGDCVMTLHLMQKMAGIATD